MQKPLIGITAGEIINNDYPWEPVTFGQRHTYIDAIIRAGGVPVTLPITEDPEVMARAFEQLDGLMLSGGIDVDPKLYGESPYTPVRPTSSRRDTADKLALENALNSGLPILAICRGMQLINVYFGGSLYQNLRADLPNALNHEISTEAQNFEDNVHDIQIDEKSKLYEILNQKLIGANSLHHQAVKELGEGLRVTSKSSDGVIESIETDDDRFIIGIQAHPESLHRVSPEWEKLFSAFIEAASAKVTA